MAELKFYGNITLDILNAEGIELVTKGQADNSAVGYSVTASSWSNGAIDNALDVAVVYDHAVYRCNVSGLSSSQAVTVPSESDYWDEVTVFSVASEERAGYVKLGEGFEKGSNGELATVTATSTTMGTVAVGDGLYIDGNGKTNLYASRKKVQTLTGSTITPDENVDAYLFTPGSDTVFTFGAITGTAGECERRFDLLVSMGSTAYNLTFPNNADIVNEPGSYGADCTYLFKFRTIDGGAHWFGECSYPLPQMTGVSAYIFSGGSVGDRMLGVGGTTTGDVVVYNVDGVDYVASPPWYDYNGPELSAGTHSVTITISRAGYQDYVQSGTATLTKYSGYIDSTAVDTRVGQNCVIDVSLPDDWENYGGTVSCVIDEVTYYGVPSNGVCTFSIPNLTAGIHYYTVYATGNGKYQDASDSDSMSVYKVAGMINPDYAEVSAYVGSNLVISGDVPSDYDGTATWVCENETGTAVMQNGRFTATIPTTNFSPGTVVVYFMAPATWKYTQATNSKSVTILSKQTPTLTLTTDGANVGDDLVITGLVNEDYDGTASCTFEGTTYTSSPAVGGVCTLTIPTTTAGPVTLTVVLASTAKYNSASDTIAVNIGEGGGGLDNTELTMTFTNSDSMPWNNLILVGSVSATDLVNGVAFCTYGNNSYTGNVDANGAFSINLSSANVTVGEQTFTIVVTSDNYNTVSDDVEVTVEKAPIYLYTSATSPRVGSNVVITTRGYQDAEMRLRASNSGRIIAVIDGVGYYTDFINGAAKHFVDSETLGVGTYNYIVNYGGDDRYLSASGSGSFKVKPSSGGAPIS